MGWYLAAVVLVLVSVLVMNPAVTIAALVCLAMGATS